jgi:hypothetical protein
MNPLKLKTIEVLRDARDAALAQAATFTQLLEELEAPAADTKGAPAEPPVEVLPAAPKPPTFVGRLYLAKNGGPCHVCGGNVIKGEKYLWDHATQRGAHFLCGKELA